MKKNNEELHISSTKCNNCYKLVRPELDRSDKDVWFCPECEQDLQIPETLGSSYASAESTGNTGKQLRLTDTSTNRKGVLCKMSSESCYGVLKNWLCEYHNSIDNRIRNKLRLTDTKNDVLCKHGYSVGSLECPQCLSERLDRESQNTDTKRKETLCLGVLTCEVKLSNYCETHETNHFIDTNHRLTLQHANLFSCRENIDHSKCVVWEVDE